MYNELIDKLNLEDLEKKDEEYINILNLIDNKHLQEELVKEEEQENDEKDEFKLESLSDIIKGENTEIK